MSVLGRLRAKLAPQTGAKKRRRGVEHAVPFDSRAVLTGRGRGGVDQFPLPKKNLPAQVQDQFDALRVQAASTRQQLDILRQTRGQREVGELKVPPHLRDGEMLDARGVERRGDVTAIVRGEG